MSARPSLNRTGKIFAPYFALVLLARSVSEQTSTPFSWTKPATMVIRLLYLTFLLGGTTTGRGRGEIANGVVKVFSFQTDPLPTRAEPLARLSDRGSDAGEGARLT